MIDLVIVNARIIDGTGAPWFVGSVGILDGNIVGIYEGKPPAAHRVIDAGLRFLAPGFIDSHTHDDIASLRDGTRTEKVIQGVTTIVTGNCSFSSYPHLPNGAGPLTEHLGSLLGDVREHEIFANFTDYKAALHREGLGPNIVSLVGHGPLRLAILGYEPRPADAAERRAMENLLDEQLEQGAFGLSLGLVYPPSSWATNEELIGLARTVARHGALLSAHIRNYDYTIEAAVEEFLALLKVSGAKGLLSHLQIAGRDNWGKMPALLDRLEEARSEGIDVSCDMYPYTAGSSTILQLLPPDVQVGGNDAVVARLAHPETRESIRQAVTAPITPGSDWHSKITQIGWDNVQIGGVISESHKHYEGRSLADIAKDEEREPFDVTADLITCDCCRTNIIMFQQSEEDLKAVLEHRLQMTGSDSIPRETGKPHPRGAGTFARKLATQFSPTPSPNLEETIRRMTSLPAQRFGLSQHGLIRPGLAADLVIFGPDVQDHATYDAPRLPPSGIATVLIAGKPVVENGVLTGDRSGIVLDTSK